MAWAIYFFDLTTASPAFSCAKVSNAGGGNQYESPVLQRFFIWLILSLHVPWATSWSLEDPLPFLSDFHLLCASYETIINTNQGDTELRGLPANGHTQQMQSAHCNGLAPNTVIERDRFCCTSSFHQLMLVWLRSGEVRQDLREAAKCGTPLSMERAATAALNKKLGVFNHCK